MKEKMIKIIKNKNITSEDVGKLWGEKNIDEQKKEINQVITYITKNLKNLRKNLLHVDSKEKAREIRQRIGERVNELIEVWKNTETSLKMKQSKLFSIIVKEIENYREKITEELLNGISSKEEIRKANVDIINKSAEVWRTTSPYVWRNISPDVQKATINDIMETLKDSPDAIGMVWSNTSLDVKKATINDIMETLKDSPEAIKWLWLETSSDVQKATINDIMETLKDRPEEIEWLWDNISSDVKKATINDIMETLKDSPDAMAGVWSNTSPDVQKESYNNKSFNGDLLSTIINGIIDKIGEWEKKLSNEELNEEEKKNIKENISSSIVRLRKVWVRTESGIQNSHSDLVIKVMETLKDSPDAMADVWSNTSPDVQKATINDIMETLKDSPDAMADVWSNTSPDVQKESYNNKSFNGDLLSTIINGIIDKIGEWEKNLSNEELNEEEKKNIKENISSSIVRLRKVWVRTESGIQNSHNDLVIEVIKILKDSPDAIGMVWRNTSLDVKKATINDIMETLRDSPEAMADVWSHTSPDVQKEISEKIKEYIINSEELKYTKAMCSYFPMIFLNNMNEIMNRKKNQTFYQELVQHIFGEIEIKENDKSLIIPEDLKKIIINPKDDKEAGLIYENLKEIIAKWNLIKEQFLLMKANNIKNDGLEIKLNINKILTILDSLNRAKPKNMSEEELMKADGSDRIGKDTQYTNYPEKALDRAYELANLTDKHDYKHFPIFSLEGENDTVLEILAPGDKNAITLGYETNCCFRPNGNADQSGESPYSLLQYCCGTPYGGVLRVINREKTETYMGTPILRNGNCLMFHSYETARDGKKNTEVNNLLVEAAKTMIEESDGKIKAVFMTNLYNGKDRLDICNKIEIGSFFKAYSGEEYENYKDMYTNLGSSNVVLAIRIGDKTLTGDEIVKWFNKKCNGDIEVFKEKLGLEFGKVEETEKYKTSNKKEGKTRVIENAGLVNKFYKEYKKLHKTKHIVSLIKRKKILEQEEKQNSEEYRIIEEELQKYESSNEYTDYIGFNTDKLQEVMIEIEDKAFQLFQGNNLETIKEYYGVTDEEIEEIIREDLNTAPDKDIKESKAPKSNAMKATKNKIIGQMKRKPELESLISKIANDTITKEELETLQNAGIETGDYIKYYMEGTANVSEEEQKETRRNQQIEKLKKDPKTIKLILSKLIFSKISEEEIDQQIYKDTVSTIKSEIFEFYRKQDIDGVITEEEKAEINEKIHELNIEDLLKNIIQNSFKDYEENETVKKLKEEFGIDIKIKYDSIQKQRGKIIKKVQQIKFRKLQADISIGIDKLIKWEGIRHELVEDNETERIENVERVIYSNSWFIELGDGKSVIYIKPDAPEMEKEQLKEKLKEIIIETRRKNSTLEQKSNIGEKNSTAEETTNMVDKEISRDEIAKAVKFVPEGNIILARGIIQKAIEETQQIK